jgi:hypothetical protein
MTAYRRCEWTDRSGFPWPHGALRARASGATPHEEDHQHDGCEARTRGPECIPLVPAGLEALPRTLSGRLVHRVGVQPLKPVVQGDVDRDRRQLHAEKSLAVERLKCTL